MAPNHQIDEPARWKLVEATNGYDSDKMMYHDLRPVSPGPPPRNRSARPGQALTRFLSALAARRRRKQPVGHAGAVGSTV